MSFLVSGLAPAPFENMFGLPDEELARLGVKRFVADADSHYPDRIELRDARPGESVLLLNYVHQPAATPYRASHAIFVREGASAPCAVVDAMPDALRRRPLSLRAFDDEGMIVGAELASDQDFDSVVAGLFRDARASYIHAHFARRGCYAALIERVEPRTLVSSG